MPNFELELDASLLGIPMDFKGKFGGPNTVFNVSTQFNSDNRNQQSIAVDEVLKRLFALFGTQPFMTTGLQLADINGQYKPSDQQLDMVAKITAPLANTELYISLKEALVAGLNLDFNFDLADIPLIEGELKQPLNLSVTFGTKAIQNYTIPNTTEKVSIESGIALKTNLKLPSELLDFNYPLKDFSDKAAPENLENNLTLPEVPPQKNTKWFKVSKIIGPVSLNKIGLQWKNKKVWVLLNMDIETAGLRLSLLGLKAGSSLNPKKFKPKFDIEGVGLFYQKGVIEIGGAFFKVQPDPAYFLGKAVFRVGNTSLAAVGGYGYTQLGNRSLFALASVGVPIGGLPFFFITGISAGFGYNSRLIFPTTNQVPDYPLLQVGNLSGQTPTKALEILGKNVVASDNNRWFAAGIHFNSFGILKSTALVLYDFDSNQFNFIGVSRLILPDPNNAYLSLRLGLQATYQQAQGAFKGEARIAPGSYIFSDSVQLNGGAACYAWLDGEHEGDFVLTVGGYHPKFQVPSHYPTVPKVQFNWAVSDKLKINGNTYFALTSSSIMAGFQLDAAYQSNNLKAWFKAATDMLLQWKPFYYDIKLKVRLGAAYQLKFLGATKNYKLDIGADLFLFGPSVGGYVKVNWTIISFTIRFGSLKNGTATHTLDWDTFNDAFLPASDKICQATVASGLIKELESTNTATGQKTKIWVLDQENLAFSTQSVIPSNSIFINNTLISAPSTVESFGIRPMNKRAVTATHKVMVRNKKTQQPVKVRWTSTVNTTGMAANLWSSVPLNTQIPKADTIQTLAGFTSLIPQATQVRKTPFIAYQEGKTDTTVYHLPITDHTITVQSQIIPTQHLKKQLTKNYNAPDTANSLWLLEQSIMAEDIIETRNDVVHSINQLFGFMGDDILVSGAMAATQTKAEAEFQSEIQIGLLQEIQAPVTAFATSDSAGARGITKSQTVATPTPIQTPRLKSAITRSSPSVSSMMSNRMKMVHQINEETLELNSRSTTGTPSKPTAKVTALKVQTGNSYVLELDASRAIPHQFIYDGQLTLQVLAFDKNHQLLTYQLLHKGDAGQYHLPIGTQDVSIKSVALKTETTSIVGWHAADNLPIINENALLGNDWFIQLQTPIEQKNNTLISIQQLHAQNLITKGNTTQQGWIDTILFNSCQEFVVVIRQSRTRKSDKTEAAANIEVSIPFVLNDDFDYNYTYQKDETKKILTARSIQQDSDGSIRIKYSTNQKHWAKATNGLAIRIQTKADWQVQGLFLFEGRTKKATWCTCQLTDNDVDKVDSSIISRVEIE